MNSLLKWFDEFSLAVKGFLLCTRKRSFWPPFIITFFAFGLLINLLSNGFSSFKLIFSGNLTLATSVLSQAFLAIFGVGKALPDFLLNFFLSLFQAVLVALVFFVFKHNRESANAESSALVAGLAILGSGCPTCGTTLLAPVLGAVLSGTTGAVSAAGYISIILNVLAFILAIFVFKKLGFTTYAIIKSESYNKKKESSDEQSR